MTKPQLSVIVTVYNEEGNIPLFCKELKDTLDSSNKSYEVILIEDGSKDKSWDELVEFAKNNHNFKLLRHGRNLGMTQVYQNGFRHAQGEYILTSASDLEIDTKYLLEIIKKLDEGYDVVNTNRVGRWKGSKLAILRTFPSKVANELIVKITGVRLKDNGSGMKGFKRFLVVNLAGVMYGEMHRFFAAYCGVFTSKITEIEVPYKDRVYGKSAYGSIMRTFGVFLDLIPLYFTVSMSKKPYNLAPGRLFGSVGVATFFIGLAITLALAVEKLVFHVDLGNRPMLIFSTVSMVLGAQLVMTGFLGELLMKIYFETGGRQVFTSKEEVNFERE